jgi:hypothetical protein
MRKKWRILIRNRSGEGYPLAAAVTLALLMLILVITQYAHLLIIASGVKDAMDEAVISTVNDNYADVYHAVREGYAAGYQPMGDGSFEESLDYGDIYGRLDGLLGLESDGECHVCISGSGKVEYQLKDLQVQIHNNGLASGETENFEITAAICLEVPISFIQKVLPAMQITVRTKAAYTPKF